MADGRGRSARRRRQAGEGRLIMPFGERLRLHGGGVEPSGAAIAFSFEGETIAARAGESLAASLAAAGHLGLRQAGPDTRRGIFCGMGACQECLVEIDGRGGQRACMVKAEPGMTVRRNDPQKAALAPLGDPPSGDPRPESHDAVIIGAGPAGLAAARVLAQGGVRPIILDERDQPGGQYFKPLAASQRFLSGGEDAQFAEGRRLIEEVMALGAEVRPGQAVWQAGIESGKVSLATIGAAGAGLITARTVLIATGAYERPTPLPGWTLPGVMTTGALQTLARSYRIVPGARILIAGNGPLNWQAALEIARGGGHVVAVLESGRPSHFRSVSTFAGMLAADPALTLQGLRMRAELARTGIPLHEGYRLAAVQGDGKAEAARAVAVSGSGAELRFGVDTVALGYGFVPSTTLVRMLGGPVIVDPSHGFPKAVRDAEGRSGSLPVWIAGDGGEGGGRKVAAAEGEIAGAAMLAALGRGVPDAERAEARQAKARALRFQRHLWTAFAAPASAAANLPDTIICRCENVTAGQIATVRASGIRDLGSLKRQTRLGMGRCQGRYCAGEALRLLRDGDLSAAKPADLFAPQAPEKPVPAIMLGSEKPEWGGHREVETRPHPPVALVADPLAATCDLLVIGAGIIGVSTALYAARGGMDTVVIDAGPANSQASGGNAGSLHVQLLSWDFGQKAMAGGNPALQTLPLQRDAVLLWKALEAELGADFEITTTGGLMVAENHHQTDFLRRKVEAERSVGIDVEVIGRADLARIAPQISERMVVASHCPLEGKINPLKATPALVAEAKRCGARFSHGHAVKSISRDGARFTVTTGAATISARRVVIAAGGWSRHVGALAGVALPIRGAPLQMLVTEPTRPILGQLVAHADRHLTMKQAANGNLIIGGAWTAGTDSSTGFARVLRESIEGNLWVAARTVPALAGLNLLRSWAAMNVNIDGAPLMGEIPGAPGLYIAATANGYTLGPLVGRMTAEMVLGHPRAPALDIFTLARFG
ncbi:FAD-dependent oxidoreductase [Mesorhizobium sp. BR1-1-16]|uniref:FAD-dependent oxidoreductase n=1 Tax=Mesorhizobium sp. BR1-1-16 TaxID=2876653 RepID=UPI001CC986ED|nr:FAD-dependent oxidoreductase [Mesorhizobium sp. BR1-1-16]MBZ9938851.1 FAD-dependent oxidoreductase [Mesorhizobium sp. BR1-1-16]